LSIELKFRAGRPARLVWAAVHAAFLLAGCVGQTVDESSDGEGLSESEQVALELEQTAGFVNDPELLAYIESVGNRIVTQGGRDEIDYRFEILDMQMPNALALPDGQIFISRGVLVLVNSEDELAGILAHEIAHVEEHHASARENFALVTSPIRLGTDIAGWATGLIVPGLGEAIVELGDSTTGLFLAPYNREQEREADRVGQSLAAAAGYRPDGLVNLLDTMAGAEALDAENAREASWFDSHPATLERVDLTRKHAGTLTPAVRPSSARDRSGVLAALEGLVVGVNPGKGFFDENWFVHPELAFVMAVPPDWEAINAAGFVGAKKPDEETFVMLALVARGSDPLEGAKAASRKLEIDVVSNARLGILNGLQAARNQARITSADGEIEILELTWIAHGGLIYQVMGIAALERFEAVEDLMRMSAHSFRPLTNEERANILVVKVDVVEGRQGETIAELAERVGTPWSVESISVVNRKPVGERLRAGELIKVGIPASYASGPAAAPAPGPLQ
jgi:predicted Zn-dependent protease